MSICIDVHEVSKDVLMELKKKSLLKITTPSGFEYIKLTRLINKTHGYIPFALAMEHDLSLPDFPKQALEFQGQLRDEQKLVCNEAYSILEKQNSVIIACNTGFGKTIIAINLACQLKLKTLIIVNKLVLLKQWKLEITNFSSTSKVVVLESKDKNDYIQCNFALVNIVNVHKMDSFFLKSFGLVIVDESHLILSMKNFKNLLYLTPRYVIALTATPYRPDDLNKLFPIFFGSTMIKRFSAKDMTIYKVMTNFKPTLKYGIKGKVDWNALLLDQSNDLERNELILKIIEDHPTRIFLVLVKRVEQGLWLEAELKKKGENVDTLMGLKLDFNKDCRVLIGTNSKIGTGFDFDRLDTLLLAADIVEYYIQYIGRILRKPNNPIIFDLVDKNAILQRHFIERCNVYKKYNCSIEDYTPS